MNDSNNQPVPDIIVSILIERHKAIDERYSSKNRSANHYGPQGSTRRDPLKPYNKGTVLRLKQINDLVAQAHRSEYYSAITGLDFYDTVQFDQCYNIAAQNSFEDKLNNEMKESQNGKKSRKPRGDKPKDIDIVSFLIEGYLELKPDEFKSRIGMSDPTITDENEILNQTKFMLNFCDFIHTYLRPELPYSAGKDFEQLITDVTKYNWEATANKTFHQYFDLKSVWTEIKEKIFSFKKTQPTNHKNAKAVNSISDTDCNFNKYKGMADPSTLTECTLPTISIHSPTRLDLSLCLDPENNRITITNHSRSTISNFIKLIERIPIDKFSTCEYEACGKCIIITDKRKRCCDKKIRTCSSAWARIKSRIKKEKAERI